MNKWTDRIFHASLIAFLACIAGRVIYLIIENVIL